MNVTPTSLILLLLVTTATAKAKAQAQEKDTVKHFTIEAQLLTRGEVCIGGLAPEGDSPSEADNVITADDTDKAAFVVERTRLTGSYDNQKYLEAKITAQHTSVWGQSGGGALGLYEAWAMLKSKQGLFAKIGRQELSYDDERILGNNDWAVAALSHDVLKMGYEGHGHKLHAILAYNQNDENTNGGSFYVDGSQPYKTMHDLWYHYDVKNFPLGASLLFMNIGMQGGIGTSKGDPARKTNYQQLLGGYLSFHPKHWNVEGAYYRQMGHSEDCVDIKAWMASIKTQYQPSEAYGLEAGFDYLSGDEYFAVPSKNSLGLTQHTTIKGFNPVYGSHHKFYGAMDFFYVQTYVNGFTPGLQNLFAGGFWKPISSLRLDASYHYYATAAKLTDADLSLGHEIEVSASFQIIKQAQLMLGYSFMAGTETMRKLKRSSDDDNFLRWGWITLTISPSILRL